MADVYVFGSNKYGIHGAGTAKIAAQYHGAIKGVSEGRQGQSYAIPTKNSPFDREGLPLEEIREGVNRFLEYARTHQEDTFHLTMIGCGHSNHLARDIGPMFKDAGSNVMVPSGFRAWFFK